MNEEKRKAILREITEIGETSGPSGLTIDVMSMPKVQGSEFYKLDKAEYWRKLAGVDQPTPMTPVERCQERVSKLSDEELQAYHRDVALGVIPGTIELDVMRAEMARRDLPVPKLSVTLEQGDCCDGTMIKLFADAPAEEAVCMKPPAENTIDDIRQQITIRDSLEKEVDMPHEVVFLTGKGTDRYIRRKNVPGWLVQLLEVRNAATEGTASRELFDGLLARMQQSADEMVREVTRGSSPFVDPIDGKTKEETPTTVADLCSSLRWLKYVKETKREPVVALPDGRVVPADDGG